MSELPSIFSIPEISEKIFSFLSYDEIAKNRVVCQTFNEVGGKMLSRGFIQLEKRHAVIYKRVKALLPRRESERRVHPLARHCDILQAVETRISMLNMTYMKYIENNLLCFIPGKVLDEMLNVLNLVQSNTTPPGTHQLLQELRDLSSMAMEHFDEHILPRVKELKEQMDERRQAFYASYSATVATLRHSQPLVVQQFNDLAKIKKHNKTYKHHIILLNQTTQKVLLKMKKQNARIKNQSVKLREQKRVIQEQAARIQEQEVTLNEIKKHMEEWDQKYKDFTCEFVRARDDSILSKTKVPLKPSMSPCSPPKFFKSTIKPRTAQIRTKASYSSLYLDLERKRKSNLLPDIPVKLQRNIGEEQATERDQSKGSDSRNKSNIKSNLSLIMENFITPITGIKSRKRKMTEDIDLK